jgi:hypothetical protein
MTGASRLRRELGPFVVPAVLLAVYAVLRIALHVLSDGGGILTPSGALDRGQAALVVATLVMRLVALGVVPIAVVYRLVMRALRRWTER